MLTTVASILLPVAQDAAEEGKKVITWMLATGLVFVVVVVLGDLIEHWRHRRKRRKRLRAAQPPPYRRV
jgi:heme/copper-type cytochrome/quinol oxidase subunit 2